MDSGNRKKGIIVVCFGTTDAFLMDRCFRPVFREIAGRTEIPCSFAVCSDKVRDRLGDGTVNFEEALLRACREGITDLSVHAIFLAPGTEQARVLETLEAHADEFESVRISEPLLPHRTKEISAILDRRHPGTEKTAVLILGHGSGNMKEAGFGMLQRELEKRGRDDMKVLLVHSAENAAQAVSEINARGFERIRTGALMLSAGHHVQAMNREIEDACAEHGLLFEADGHGLGEDPEFRSLFLDPEWTVIR